MLRSALFTLLAMAAATAATAVATAVVVGPATARAAEIDAASADGFATPAPTMARGESLTFVNRDPLARHNVTADALGADGRPLFASATVPGGTSAPVVGADALPPGTYAFFCSIHPARMRGTLTVTGPAAAAASPTLALAVGHAPARTVLRRGRLLTAITLDEAAAVTVVATVRGTTLAREATRVGAGTTRLRLPLTRRGRAVLRRHPGARVTLRARATDAAGDTARVTIRRTLTR